MEVDFGSLASIFGEIPIDLNSTRQPIQKIGATSAAVRNLVLRD